MDFIKKTIRIEGARTRTQGLMPYYEFGTDNTELVYADGDNGNWGQFVANPEFLGEHKTYESMLQKYYDMLNMVRNGIKLRKVETKEREIIYTEDVGSFEWKDDCFDGGIEPDFLYDYAAYPANDFYATEIDSLREETKRVYRYTGDETISENFIVLIDKYEDFLQLSKYLKGTKYLEGSPLGLAELNPVHIYGENEEGEPNIHYEWARYCKVIDLCIGKIDIPSRIYNKHIKVPKSMLCADVESYIEWLINYQTLSADCCNTRLWEDMGGNDMLDYLIASAGTRCKRHAAIINGLNYVIPYIEMPILITQSYTDIGVLTNIEGTLYDESLPGPSAEEDELTRPHGKLQINDSGLSDYDIDIIIHSGECLTIDQIIMCSGETRLSYPTTEAYELNPSAYTFDDGSPIYPVEVESLLQTLRARKKYIDDKNNLLPGLFQKYDNPAGEMFVCLKGDPKYYQLVVSAYTVDESGTVIDYCVKYVEDDSLSAEDIIGEQNLRTDYDPVFVGGITEAEANNILAEQKALYDSGDTANEYRISFVSAAWVMSAITSEPNKCLNGDGEDNAAVKYTKADTDYTTAEGKYFRTITTPYAGIRIAMTEEEETGELEPAYTHYFFKVKYDNSPDSPMSIPYSVGNVTNVYTTNYPDIYRGDFIIETGETIESGATFFTAKYVIGGYYYGDEDGGFIEYSAGTGDVYYEKHPFDKNHLDFVPIDGVDNVPVWSEYIDFNADSKEFYSPRYNLYRTGNTANIISATTGEQWSKTDDEDLAYAYDAYLTKEEYLTNFSLPPKVDVNVTVDRGGVSAFEKHYKLSECNTMQDLVNYGNNFFNL